MPSEPPRLAVNVGVVGHRPPTLAPADEPAVRAAVRAVLEYVRALAHELLADNSPYGNAAAQLRVVSPLAEGADRLVAEEALSLGFSLQCPLPAFREVYQEDWPSPASRAQFGALLTRADAVLELNGRRDGQYLDAGAYEAGGRLVVAHADVLIAIWDGHPGGRGGTGQIVDEAKHAGVPIAVIDPHARGRITAVVRGVAPTDEWHSVLRAALLSSLRLSPTAIPRLRAFLDAPASTPASTPAPAAFSVDRDDADREAARCAWRYRTVYKLIYGLAPLAVACAVGDLYLASVASDALPEWILPSLELLCVAAILVLTGFGRRAYWHERWLDARVLAEQLRLAEMLRPLGQTVHVRPSPAYFAAQPAESAWTDWLLRARLRAAGLPSARCTPEYLETYRRELLAAVHAQVRHHRERGESRARTLDRLERMALILFGVTAVACLAHLLVASVLRDATAVQLATLSAVTAGLPAFAAAVDGVQAQAEYKRLAERADSMQRRLTAVAARLEHTAGLSPAHTFAQLVETTRELSDLMLGEVTDWRNIIRVRALHPV